MSRSARVARVCRTSRSSRTAKLAAVPLLALALTGATACEFGSDDEKNASSVSSDKPSDKSSDKPSDKGGPPATAEQLTDALLTSQEIPAGYTAGDARVPDPSSDPEDVVSDPACEVLVGDNMSEGAAAEIERRYTKDGTGSNGEDEDHVQIGLVSNDHDVLKRKLDAYVKALRACSSFEVTNGNDSYGYEISDVRTGRHGADSVSYRLTFLSEGQVAAYANNVVSLQGSTGMMVMAFSLDGMPDEPTRFVTGQLRKIGEIGN
ncbi:hypothetical protein [Yinghuangia sp. YIM S10712]|uniref:hypothetical protein n=1 Tax=Yinghuangia sp. YIM S10712 TaxID=3436930 RepID=UPI003F53C0D2